jgi:hypothetical protein
MVRKNSLLVTCQAWKYTRASWALSYNMRSKWGEQPNMPGFPLTARLVLAAMDQG